VQARTVQLYPVISKNVHVCSVQNERHRVCNGADYKTVQIEDRSAEKKSTQAGAVVVLQDIYVDVCVFQTSVIKVQRECLFRGFSGRNARVAVYRGALYEGLAIIVITST
jgi:hypothetical protein